MNELDWLRAHVQLCLQDVWEVCRVEVDDDGDFPFRWGTAAGWVQVEAGPPAVVRVVAHAACHIRRSARLLTELNEINARSRTINAYWHNGVVFVEQAVFAPAVTGETLDQACRSVGAVANDIGVLVAAMFDGVTPFDSEPASVEEEA